MTNDFFVPDFDAVGSPVVEDYDGSPLRMFKDCHLGERCFVLGNGPSLSETELAPLADEVTFGSNGIFYMTRQCGFTPTYYVVEDNHVVADNLPRINSVEAVARFFPSRYSPVIEARPDTHFLPTDWSFYWGTNEWYERPRFSHDISSVIYVGQSVTFMSLQLAAYMGFKEIYLVGVDYDYRIPDGVVVDGFTITSVAADPNHFHPDYFGEGKKWHLPKLESVGKAFECARTQVQTVNASIYNATIGGELEVFPRVDYRELLGRPSVDEPNLPRHYLVARSLRRASMAGARSVSIGRGLRGTAIEHLVAASDLILVDDQADLFISERALDHVPDGTRVLLLGSDGTLGGEVIGGEGLAELLMRMLVRRRAAFLTRSILEFSPDGESVVIPALGRIAQRRVDDLREFGVDDIGSLEDARVTRWVHGRSLSIERLETLATDIMRNDISVAVVDGYIYVQSRWKASEHPAEVLSTRHRKSIRKGRHD